MSEEIKNCVCGVKKASKDNNIMLARKLTVLETKIARKSLSERGKVENSSLVAEAGAL